MSTELYSRAWVCLIINNFEPKIGPKYCRLIHRLYEAGDKTCAACHPECDGGCHGPGPEHCSKCRNLRDGMHCVSQCPVNKYSASQFRPSVCLPCHVNCVGGCSGPDNTIGPNGCRSCHKAVLNADASVVSIYQ